MFDRDEGLSARAARGRGSRILSARLARRMRRTIPSRSLTLLAAACALAACTSPKHGPAPAPVVGRLLVGQEALGDHRTDAPGVRRKLTVADLPAPYATKSATERASVQKRPAGALPQVPAGFTVSAFAEGLENPRQARVAPNGDLFVAESKPGRIRILRDADGDGKPEISDVFAEGLDKPFGIAFYPPGIPKWVYVANTGSVVRYAYSDGNVRALGAPEVVVASLPSGGQLFGGGHWTRDVVFSNDGKQMFVSVGSKSNVDDDESEADRARIFVADPDGKNMRPYATGIRNAVGLAVHPDTGELYASVNERDELGDHLVPDYVTHVKENGFYGWPWFYLGNHQDPRHAGKHPELADKVVVPDVLLQSHSASLGMVFHSGARFPKDFRGGAFAAEHGSWNRALRTGYKVVYLPFENGKPTGEYVDFMTGMVDGEGKVWGRPVAVASAKDGSLFVTDDGGDCVWRVAYGGPITASTR